MSRHDHDSRKAFAFAAVAQDSVLPRKNGRTESCATTAARPGVALILALGFIAMLSLLIAGMMGTLRTRLVDGERRDQRSTLRADAESALGVAMARLAVFKSDATGIHLNGADLERLAENPLAGWTPPDGATVAVRLRDESGLFPINTTDTDSLSELFQDIGVGESTSEALADCLVDWTDADNRARPLGAEVDAYGTPGLPANRPLRSFDELRRVRGFDGVFFEADGSPNETGRKLAAVITYLDTGTGPNVNGAPESVLHLLTSRSGGDANAIMAFRTPLNYPDDRTHSGVFATAGDLAQVNAPKEFADRVTYASRCIRVTITVSKGDLRYVLDALVAANPSGGATPVTVLRRADEALLADLGEDE